MSIHVSTLDVGSPVKHTGAMYSGMKRGLLHTPIPEGTEGSAYKGDHGEVAEIADDWSTVTVKFNDATLTYYPDYNTHVIEDLSLDVF